MPVSREHGFTLIELIVVMILTGLLSTVVMQFITTPIDIYVDQSRRAALVGEAQSVIDGIAHDVHLAVPNSIRVGCSGGCVELMRGVSGGRYRAQPPGDTLSFIPADADSGFAVLGNLTGAAGVTTSADPDACGNGTASCLVVYNTGFAGTDLWAGDNAATVTAVTGGPAFNITFDNSRFSSGNPVFPASSPGQRFTISDTPVTFLCDTTLGTLRRYWGYTRRSLHSDHDSHAELTALSNPAENALMAERLSSCQFSYTAGTPTRNGVLSLRLTVSESGESVTLFHQVSVSNVP